MNEQKTTSTKKSFVVLFALLRLALLVGPEFVLVKSLVNNPLLCVLAAVAYLAFWLSVDVWPFRARAAAPSPKAAKVVAPAASAAPAYARNLTKAQWVTHLFCRVAILFALFHSKLTV